MMDFELPVKMVGLETFLWVANNVEHAYLPTR